MELTGEGTIAVLLDSLKYSIQRVSEAQGTPYEVRRENLGRLEAVQNETTQIRDASSSK